MLDSCSSRSLSPELELLIQPRVKANASPGCHQRRRHFRHIHARRLCVSIAIIAVAGIVTAAPITTMPAVMFTIELIVRVSVLVSQLPVQLGMLPGRQSLLVCFGMLFVELIMNVAVLGIELFVLVIVP